METELHNFVDDRYFTKLAAAFARGRLNLSEEISDAVALNKGTAGGLRFHKFKRQTLLPRVQRVLGLLLGISPHTLLDIGSGRGAFLWPLLDAFHGLDVTAVDHNPLRVSDIEAVRWGGVKNLRAVLQDAHKLEFPDKMYDVVTMLEVLEHLAQPSEAACEAVRLAQRMVIITVPSKKDDNPEHIHLFKAQSLTSLFLTAGARKVNIEFILNHIVAIAHC